MPDHSHAPVERQDNRMKKLHVVFLIAQLAILFIALLLLLHDGNYGWTLFGIIPFSIGLTVGVYTRTFRTKGLLKGFFLVLLVITVVSLLLLALGAEGVICVLMATGLIGLPAFAGVAVGFFIRNQLRILSLLLIFLLNTSSMVYDSKSTEVVHSVASVTVVVDAPKEKVWEVLTHPVAFRESNNWFLRAGVSHPTAMFLQRGPDHRFFLHCTYTNGHTRLPVVRLEPAKCLRFTMRESIKTMTEVSLPGRTEPPHLEGYFAPEFGEFTVAEMGKRQCRVTARTAYSYRIEPAFYWKWWTDYLTNAMHTHVLTHVKSAAER